MIRCCLILAAVLGCERISIVAIFPEAGSNDLVIATVENDAGEIEQVEWFLASDRPPVLSVPPDDRIRFFSIRDGDLITAEGETFATGLADRIAIYPAGEGTGHGDCGRCTGLTDRAPQIVRDGDECPLPPFAEPGADDDPSLLEGRLRIGLDGTCPCPRFREDPDAAPPALELVEDGPDAWPYESMAANVSGTVFLFSEARALAIAPTGERIAREELPFRGRVISSALSANGTAFTVSYREAERRLDVFGADLAPLAEPDLGMMPSVVIALREGSVLVLGEGADARPSAFLCASDPPFSCRPVSFADSTPAGRTLLDAVRMSDALLIFAGIEGFIAMDRLPRDASDRPAQRAFAHRIGGELVSVGSAGGWLLACLRTDAGAEVIAGRVDRTVLTATASAPAFEVVHRSAFCRPFSAVPGREAARIVFPGSDQAVIDGSDPAQVAVEVDPPQLVISGVAVNGTETFDDGTSVAWTGELGIEDVWVLDAARQVYGGSRPSSAPLTTLASAGDRVIALRSDGSGELFFEDRTESIRIAELPAPIQQAAADTAGGGLLIAGRSYLGRAPLDGGSIALIDVPLQEIGPFVKVVELAPGVFLLVTEDALFALRGEELSTIDPEWDDPTTLEAEGEPPPCDRRYLDASAREGRGYVVGCWGTILEVDAPRARRISLFRSSQSLHVEAGVNAVLTAAFAVCPDDVLIGAHGRIFSDYERGRIWELAPLDTARACADPTFGRCLLDADRVTKPGRFASGFPQAFAGDSEAMFAVFSNLGGSVQRIGTDGRFRFPEVLTLAARAPWGELFVAGKQGHVLRDGLSR